MGKLIVERDNNFIGCIRTAKIFLDNKEVGMVRNGTKEILEVPETIYTMQVGFGSISGMSNKEDIAIRDHHDVYVTLNIMPFLQYLLILVVAAICGYTIFHGLFFGPVYLIIPAILILILLQLILSKYLLSIKVDYIKKEQDSNII